MKVVVGVDAGGSSTVAAVSLASTGEILARHAAGPGAVLSAEVDRAAARIVEAVTAVLREAEGAAPDVVVVGAAGVGRHAHRDALRDTLRGSLPCPVHVLTDAEIAHRAAFHGAPGVLLIVGTGAIAFALDPDGEIHRVGGYGAIFADEIGGYNLGRGALAAIGQAHDGRGAPTALSGAVLRLAGVTTFDELVSWANVADREAIASIATVVQDLAASGDEVAGVVITEATGHLVAYVHRVAELASLDQPDIALSGGLVQSGSPLRVSVSAAITEHIPGARVLPDAVEPLLGALEIAQEFC